MTFAIHICRGPSPDGIHSWTAFRLHYRLVLGNVKRNFQRLARDASLLLVGTGLLLRLASGETSGLVALGGGACAWLLFNSRAMQRYMELVYAQRLYRAQSANRPGSAQRRLANQAAYRERKRRERSGRS